MKWRNLHGLKHGGPSGEAASKEVKQEKSNVVDDAAEIAVESPLSAIHEVTAKDLEETDTHNTRMTKKG